MAHILVADDDSSARTALRSLLQGAGYRVTTVANGELALSSALSERPDAVIIDILMPVCDGFELCRRWQQHAALREVPIIVYTGTYTRSGDQRLALQLGVARYLIKPMGADHLLLEIDRTLQGPAGGGSALSELDPLTDHEYLQRYTGRLVNELETKMQELERLNQDLRVEGQAHRQTALRLRSSELRFRLLAENAQDLIYRVHLQPTVGFDYLSPSCLALTGYSAREFYDTATLFEDLVDPEDQQDLRDLLEGRRAFEVPLVLRLICKDGRRIWTEQRSRGVYGPDGELLAVEGIVRDVTERYVHQVQQQRLQAQLVQAQRLEALGALAGGVAHDFNNQLMVISSFAELVQEAIPPDSPLREDLDTIIEAAGRSTTLTRQLLAFGRKEVILPRRIDPVETLVALERMLRRVIGEDIRLQIQHGDVRPWVFIDPGQFEQVLVNLAVNARDAMPGGGRLVFCVNGPADSTVHTSPDEPMSVSIRVTDTGHGMDEAIRDRIFEPFFTTKEAGRGTGLGLSIAYGVITQAKGSIKVEQTGPAGTTFVIELPLASADMVGYDDVQCVDKVDRDGTETVLIVDDEPGIREIVYRTLTSRGYTVLVAANAGEALLYAERHSGPIDLVLTDIVMPLMNGIELVQRLSSSRPSTRVLLMTGFTDHDVLRAALPEQSHPLIRKPFGAAELSGRVRAILDQSLD